MKNVLVITGAAGGIAKEFLKLMKNEKGIDEIWAVDIAADKLDELKKIYGDKFIPCIVDVTKDEDLLAFQDKLAAEDVCVKWLINTAGTRAFYNKGASLPRQLLTVRTNLVGNMAMCYITIPHMKKGSHILNVSSSASFQPLPSNNSYAAAKVGLRFFTKGLEYELKGKGIKITCACPGWVRTPLMEFGADEVKAIDRLPGAKDPDFIAKKCLKDARKGKSICFPTLKVHIDYYLTKYSPTAVILWYAQHVETDRYDDFKALDILS